MAICKKCGIWILNETPSGYCLACDESTKVQLQEKQQNTNGATKKVEKWLNDNPGYWLMLGAFANTGGPITAAKQAIAKACDEGYITEAELRQADQQYFANLPQLKKAMENGWSLPYPCSPDDYDF